MIKKVIDRYLFHRHTWRELAFDELNQIYAAMLVRGLSVSMVGLFIPVFMTRLGYTITQVLVVISVYFIVRVFFDLVSAHLVARFGPKRTMIFGQILFAMSSAQFLTLEQYAWPLWLLGMVWGASQSCFFISFDVGFSSIRTSKHGGKELGYIEIMSKIGSIMGPILGGVVSITIGSQYIFAISTFLLIAGLLPMLRTPEPIRLRRRLTFRHFKVEKIFPSLPSFIGMSVETTLATTLWPLFMGIFVLPGDAVFMKIGLLTSASAILSILITRRIGRLVDEGAGRRLLRFGAVTNALIISFRVLVSTYAQAFISGVASDIATLSHKLPFYKGYYDYVDSQKDERIVFVAITSMYSSLIKAVIYLILLMISTVTTGKVFFFIGFTIAAVSSLLVTTEKFKSFNKKGV